MKKFRYFILVLAGVAAMMLGGCKDKEKYDESAFQDDLEPLSEDEVEAMDENGTYTDKDEVAQYIYEYGHVPSNLTAADYDNADSMLPVEDGVTYQQCSLDDAGKQKLIFTQDAKRIYYTDDDGQSFDEIY